MAKLLKGQVALVTGGGRGIGRAIALHLGRLGATVIVSARTRAEIVETARLIAKAGGVARAVATDITAETSVRRLFQEILRRHGQLDVLINNAGIGLYGEIATFKADDFARVVATNITGTFLCSRAALGLMMPRRRGYIINIASVVGFRGYALQAAYTAAKHGVLGFTKSLAIEAQPHGIRVSAINPGGVDTAMIRKARPDLDPAHLLHPDDVAQAIEYLLRLSDRAAVDEIYLRRRKSAPF